MNFFTLSGIFIWSYMEVSRNKSYVWLILEIRPSSDQLVTKSGPKYKPLKHIVLYIISGSNCAKWYEQIRVKLAQMNLSCIFVGLVVSVLTFLCPMRGRISLSSPLVIFFHPSRSFFQPASSSFRIMKSWTPTTCVAEVKTEISLNLNKYNYWHCKRYAF